MTFNWSGKRRWVALILLIAGFVVMFTIPPVIPVIQLPGERYPDGWDFLGLRMTNTLMTSIVVWILLILLALYVNSRRPKGSNEVPPGGFYNIFEMLFEGLYGFVRGLVGEKYLRYIFSFFMTIFLIVLLSNWIELIPGVDSIGFLHEVETGNGYETNQTAPGGIHILDPKCPWVSPEDAEALTPEAEAARAAQNCSTGTGVAVAAAHGEEGDHAVVDDHDAEEAAPETVVTEAATVEAVVESEAVESEGDLHEETVDTEHGAEGVVTEGEAEAEHAEEAGHHATPGDPTVPWHIVPFLRAPSTDLNMTAALALISVVMTQVLGFKALGAGYLKKFFNFGTLFTSPLGGIDVAVGLLELIGEFARILSFAFRLLGNIFAGAILLFVMSFLIPFLPWPFFILEFFVHVIQALVFAMLTAIFMGLATAGHHGGDEHHDEEHAAAEAH